MRLLYLLLFVVVAIVLGIYFGKSIPQDVTFLESFSSKVAFVRQDKYFTSLFSTVETTHFEKTSNNEQQNLIGKIIVISDSHSGIDTFRGVLDSVSAVGGDALVHLGDVSATAEVAEFVAIEQELNLLGTKYYVLPGDHDYNWFPEYGLSNFNSVFGETMQMPLRGFSSVEQFNEKITFIYYDNSLKEKSYALEAFLWLKSINLDKDQKYVLFASTPLWSPYFSSKIDPLGDSILAFLADYDVLFFYGDTHVFSHYIDDKYFFNHVTVGASGEYKNPLPQFVVLEIFENGDMSWSSNPVYLK